MSVLGQLKLVILALAGTVVLLLVQIALVCDYDHLPAGQANDSLRY